MLFLQESLNNQRKTSTFFRASFIILIMEFMSVNGNKSKIFCKITKIELKDTRMEQVYKFYINKYKTMI